MLTVEEIKKCIEEFKPEGCKIEPDGAVNIYDVVIDRFTNHTDTVEYINYYYMNYPLFLQRVIEGINRQYPNGGRYWIETDFKEIEILDCKTKRTVANWYFDEFQGDIDQAKEQAIKYILDRLA